MKIAMGITSASTAPRVAKVWNANEPMPTATTTMISASTGQSREPARRQSQNAAAAAIRNAALVSALAGSAQNDASVRSQYRSIGAHQFIRPCPHGFGLYASSMT